MNIDQLNPTMQKYLDAMDKAMLHHYEASPISEWVQVPDSQLVDIDFSITKKGKEADPYLKLSDVPEDKEIRYDKQYTNGYNVKWSPLRGTFFVYKFTEYHQCFPTQY